MSEHRDRVPTTDQSKVHMSTECRNTDTMAFIRVP